MGVIIQSKEVFSSEWGLDRDVVLHSEQLVVEVIDIMLKEELYTMPVFYNKKHIGVVRFQDLISFLTHEERGENLIFHKLNYSIESVMVMMTERGELPYTR
ncbi:hypothetical protein [Pedobacter sp. V48]|uniref:hypothetical protein n=1 Tax=Pedobacter sp. V48 TaxID=509635 RepID=UPI0003E44BC6|nr:hypothetical protein [Pedobacter sp. V48]ETZ21399.1 hypothetical protein N824_28430 [Pedobacter sp. V48]